MATVEIEYCVPCGFLDRAVDVQRTLLQTFGERLDRVALVTGDHGVFVVRADGDVVYDKAEEPLDVDEVARRVRARL
ncbi:MAG: SelT/SelW/SelH family protein [Haloarculaceae archaeon]